MRIELCSAVAEEFNRYLKNERMIDPRFKVLKEA